MTEMLDAAVAKLATLPDQEQDRIAQWLLQELPDEELWPAAEARDKRQANSSEL